MSQKNLVLALVVWGGVAIIGLAIVAPVHWRLAEKRIEVSRDRKLTDPRKGELRPGEATLEMALAKAGVSQPAWLRGQDVSVVWDKMPQTMATPPKDYSTKTVTKVPLSPPSSGEMVLMGCQVNGPIHGIIDHLGAKCVLIGHHCDGTSDTRDVVISGFTVFRKPLRGAWFELALSVDVARPETVGLPADYDVLTEGESHQPPYAYGVSVPLLVLHRQD